MDSFEWNKVAAAVIVGLLLIMVLSTVSGDIVYSVKGPEQPAYRVEVASAEPEQTEEAEDTGPTLGELFAEASVEKGERIFRQCTACHSIEEGGPHKQGPNLYAVVGAPVGGKDGFNYSSALSDYNGDWTYDLLYAWMANPNETIPGNKMTYAGLRKPQQRADVIAYLAEYTPAAPAFPQGVEDQPAAGAIEENTQPTE